MPQNITKTESGNQQDSQNLGSQNDSFSNKSHNYQVANLAKYISEENESLDDKTLLVTMLGNFSISQNGADEEMAVLSNLGGRSRRLWLIIAYLVINRFKGVSATELIDLLWPEVDAANPQTRLQNNISRTRAMLDNGSFDDPQNLIRFKDGLYWWAPDRETVLDVDLFEEAVRSMGTDIVTEDIDRALEVCELYQGDFLAQATEEAWCANLNIYYRSLYTNFASRVLAALKREERNSDIKRLCLSVIDIDPTIEEFNIALMQALVAEGNANKAIDHYEYIKTIFHDIYGVNVSPEIEIQRNLALEVMYGNKFSKQAIIDYFNDSDLEDGAFLCNTVTFREIVQLHIRMMQRSGESSQIVAIEFNAPNRGNDNIEKNIANIKRLEQVLQHTLRSGDPITKMGRDVFLILLPGANGENGEMVTKRIIKNYFEEFPFSRVNFKTWQVDLKEL